MRTKVAILALALMLGACQSVSELRCYPLGCTAYTESAPLVFDPLAQTGVYEAEGGARVTVAGDRVRFEWSECQVITARLGEAKPDTTWVSYNRIRYPLEGVVVTNAVHRGAGCNNDRNIPDHDLSAVVWRTLDRNGDYLTSLVVETSRNYPSVRMGFAR